MHTCTKASEQVVLWQCNNKKGAIKKQYFCSVNLIQPLRKFNDYNMKNTFRCKGNANVRKGYWKDTHSTGKWNVIGNRKKVVSALRFLSVI